MIKRCLSLFSLALAILSSAGASVPQDRTLPLDRLEKDIEKALRDFHVPGLSIGIVKDGRTVLLKGYGVKQAGGREPVDEHTVFGLGSATKTFTAGLAAVLVEEGRLGWGDRVADHLPDFRLSETWLTKEARMDDLLSHRVGVEDLPLLFLGTTRDRNEIVAKTGLLRPQIGFRTGWAYSNIMFIAAGELAARIAGTSWDEALRDKIFDPLSMKATGSRFRNIAAVKNRVSPHWYENGEPRPIPWSNMDATGPAGSVYSSAADMVQWLRLHLEGGTLDGRKFWSSGVQAEMFFPHSLLPDIHFGWKTSLSAYALGWFVTDYRGRAVVWHGGNCDGMSAVIGLRTDDRLGIVILQNTFPTRFEYDLMLRIMDMFAGLPEYDWRDLGESETISLTLNAFSPREIEQSIDPDTSRSLEGRYVSKLYGTVDVRNEAGRLVLRFRDYPAAVLHPDGGLNFTADFGDKARGMFGLILGGRSFVQAVFSAGPDGLITRLDVLGFGEFKKLAGTRRP
ncbi:MAG: serine hydrolase [Candidatus Aminicenantes bacterium]|nr:serine hydrolase [Candidatus Aminicenantes bacterium]